MEWGDIAIKTFDKIREKRGLPKDAQAALLLDGHPWLLEKMRHHVAVILGASHTSHIAQVMDIGPYGPLKAKAPLYMLEKKRKEAAREEKDCQSMEETLL